MTRFQWCIRELARLAMIVGVIAVLAKVVWR